MSDQAALILAALVTGMFAVLSTVQVKRSGDARNASRDVRDRIGVPNGKGNVVQMQERTIELLASFVDSQANQDRRLAQLEEFDSAIGRRLTNAETQLADHGIRLSRIELEKL